MSAWLTAFVLALSLVQAKEQNIERDDARALARVSTPARRVIYRAAKSSRIGRRGAAELARICWRESRCREIGAHKRDARFARRQFDAAKKRGWIDFSACPRMPTNTAMYGTRGPMGLVAAYHLRLLKPCANPQILDTYEGSLFAAARKIATCEWCERCSDRAKAWAGRTAWKHRTVARRFANVRRHCGPTRARLWLASPWAW